MNFELKPRVDDTAKGSQASGANRPSSSHLTFHLTSSHLSSHLTSPPTSSKETSEILQEAVLKLQSSSVTINHPSHHLHHLHPHHHHLHHLHRLHHIHHQHHHHRRHPHLFQIYQCLRQKDNANYLDSICNIYYFVVLTTKIQVK